VPQLSVDACCAIFARGVRDKALALDQLDLTKAQSSVLRKSIAVDVRKLCDMVFPTVRAYEISAEAAAAASARHVDLQTQTWDTQPRFDPGRKIFHYEHMVTVADIIDAVLQADDEESATDALACRIRVAWILKEEDARLTDLGYRHRRPDPDAAYAHAGIKLLAPTT
jgi:hypothetical protein